MKEKILFSKVDSQKEWKSSSTVLEDDRATIKEEEKTEGRNSKSLLERGLGSNWYKRCDCQTKVTDNQP